MISPVLVYSHNVLPFSKLDWRFVVSTPTTAVARSIKFSCCQSVHTYIHPEATDKKHTEGISTWIEDELVRYWWLEVKGRCHFDLKKKHILAKTKIQMLILKKNFHTSEVYVPKVKSHPHCEPAKMFFWPLFNTLTQEQKRRLWPYFLCFLCSDTELVKLVLHLKLWWFYSSPLKTCDLCEPHKDKDSKQSALSPKNVNTYKEFDCFLLLSTKHKYTNGRM